MTQPPCLPPSTPPPSRTALHLSWPVLLMALTLAAPSAWAHGGENHDDAPPAGAHNALQASPTARTSARTDAFELVAVWEAGDSRHPPSLTLYLDKADTNEPVQQASIDVESGTFKASAKPVSPGVYSVAAAALAKPGRHPLTFTVQSEDNTDLLDATLVTHDATAPDGHEAHAPSHAPRRLWLLAGVTLIAATGWLAHRIWTRIWTRT